MVPLAKADPPKVFRVPRFTARLREPNSRSDFLTDEQYAALQAKAKYTWLRGLLAVAYNFNGFSLRRLRHHRRLGFGGCCPKAGSSKGLPMKEPGLDNRHRDKSKPKGGEIQQKRSDTLNKNLPTPIPEFSPNAMLGTMRKKTGKTSVAAVRKAAKNL